MFPPFSQELALHYLRELSDDLNSGRASLIQLAKESEERKNQGLMLGCLVCQAWEEGRWKRHILYACSGIARELNSKNGIVVPPIVSPQEISAALAENDAEIHQLTEKINSCDSHKAEASELRKELTARRTRLTDQSLRKVFSLYKFTRFDGSRISLNEIILKHGGRLPPTGTGDCCAPKLLSYAFEHAYLPVSMAEIYYGQSFGKKLSGQLYPPCDERCGYILPEILGLEILYRDRDIVVVNKAAGLLSVPGRGQEKYDSVESRLKTLFPLSVGEGSCSLNQPAVHRLDMETSGLLILAMNKESHSELNRQFAEGLVQKKYIALLDGILRGRPDGHIELKFRLDVDNRPYQIYDEENGKLAVTDYHKSGVEVFENPLTGQKKKVTRIEFFPRTGRTHQLRLAAADPRGLNLPIVGDSLYGSKNEGERLMLHSSEIEFFHPKSRKKMKFVSSPSF